MRGLTLSCPHGQQGRDLREGGRTFSGADCTALRGFGVKVRMLEEGEALTWVGTCVESTGWEKLLPSL